MKKFIFKSLCFLLPFLIIGVWLEYKFSKYPNIYSIKKEEITVQANDTEILILGPSHTMNALNPAFFSKKTYNFANWSQSLYYDKAILDFYINKLPKLKTVILPISYFSMWYQLEDEADKWRIYFFYKEFNIPNDKIHYLELKAWSKTMLYPQKKALDIVLSNFEHEKEKLYYQGWLGSDTTSYQFDTLNVKTTINRHNKIINEINLKQNITYLEEIITKLQQKNINIILIQTPFSEAYNNARLSKYVIKNDSIIKTITDKYKISYYDYSKLYVNNRLYLSNHDHLSFLGAEKFSRVIDSLVMQQK